MHVDSVRYRVLACDYDGTLATHGVVEKETFHALERVARSGRRLVLVTGRELASLHTALPEIGIFDWIVAENGGLLYRPSTHEERPLAPPPSAALIARLKARGVEPLSIGRTIVATWEPQERAVFEAIHELGLELQVIFNKGAVMVLPSGVNKQTGLEAALACLGLSRHNCAGAGDAENDHAFLSNCECSVAVANALPALKAAVDWVTPSGHGAGVRELIELLLHDDLASLEPLLTRHRVALGKTHTGDEVTIEPYGRVVLVAGSSGSGKSTAATGLLERLVDRKYQACIFDPEGDYEGFESAIACGSPEQPPELEQVLHVLTKPDNQAVVNLLDVPLADRPQIFLHFFTRLQELRVATSRPHWIVVDEAHHVLSEGFEPARKGLPGQIGAMLLVTVHPESLTRELLERVDVLVAAGTDANRVLEGFSRALGRPLPPLPALPARSGEALYWEPKHGAPMWIELLSARSRLRRHRRKYARGELGPDKSFYFRGPENKLNLRAQNLVVFNQTAEGIDDETWLFHLREGAYSRWIRESIKDQTLANEVDAIEKDPDLTPAMSRSSIRTLIEERYTLPA